MKFLPILFLAVFYLFPALAYGQSFNLIVCDGPDCDFEDLVQLARNVINFLIFLSTFLATLAFAYAGFILLTSAGSESNKTRAKTIFFKVLIGYLWILGAWVLIYTITSVLLVDGFSLLGAPGQ